MEVLLVITFCFIALAVIGEAFDEPNQLPQDEHQEVYTKEDLENWIESQSN